MIFAWQGWQLEIPDEWSPVKLRGTFESGYALLSDIHRPWVGLRWSTPGRRFDSKQWARQALVQEIGQLAADEARSSDVGCYQDGLLCSETDPPGRDILVATSRNSGRTIEIVQHVYKDEQSLMDLLQHGLVDSCKDNELSWSIFDLSCRTGAEWRLETHQLNAGDLNLEFARGSERLKIRWLSIAHLALKRMSIERWLEEQIRPRLKSFIKVDEHTPLQIELSDGRVLQGVSCRLHRRRLAMWNVGLPTSIFEAALHDVSRDRLVFIEGKDLAAVEKLVRTIGWAETKRFVQEVMC